MIGLLFEKLHFTDTNVVTLITGKEAKELPKMTKEEVAVEIFNEIIKISSHC